MFEAGTRGASASISTTTAPVFRSRTITDTRVDPSLAADRTVSQSDCGPATAGAVTGMVSRAVVASISAQTGRRVRRWRAGRVRFNVSMVQRFSRDAAALGAKKGLGGHDDHGKTRPRADCVGIGAIRSKIDGSAAGP